MIIVQTLILDSSTDPIFESMGFVSPEFNWMSWCLSCLQLATYYREVHLYTNEKGKEILIDRLKLPYTKVFVVGAEVTAPPGLWAYYKIHTYSIQNRPFIHVDGDVFIWDKIKPLASASGLIVQNIEHAQDYYRKIYTHLSQQGMVFPPVIQQDIQQERFHAINAGILGGNDIDFFRAYAAAAFKFIKSNADKLKMIDSSGFNMAFEQHLFYCLAMSANKKITSHLDEVITDMSYKGFANFPGMPGINNYLHLVNKYKSNLKSCLLLARQLRVQYPSFYYSVIANCLRAGVPIKLIIHQENINNFAYWKRQYNQEKLQEQKFQKVFTTTNILQKTSFYFNRFVRSFEKPGKKGHKTLHYKIPNSLTTNYDEHDIDEIDEILAISLRVPKTISQLCDDIVPYFDEEDVQNNKNMLSELITLKIKNGCISNIYLIGKTA